MREPDLSDFRDAFIFWIIAAASALIGSIFASYAAAWPLPLTVAMILSAAVFYVGSVGLLYLGGHSAVAGFRSLRQ